MLTLVDPLEHARRVHGSRTAVIDGAVRFTYAELHARSFRLAEGLRRLAVPPRGRVALLALNGHRYLEAFFGVPASGRVLVPLNTRLAEAELRSILEHSGASVLITDREPGSLASAVERVIRIPDEYEKLLEHPPESAEFVPDETDLAALFYTGGTTGVAKGVMLTHRNLVANAFHKSVACSLAGSDVFLAAAAMFHVAGIAPLVGLTWLGATMVSVPSFDPSKCLDAIERYAVTVAMPVPTMLAALVAEQQRKPRRTGSLRMLGHAGSPIATQTIEAAHAAFFGVELAQFYGATETASIVTCLRHEEDAIGTPLLGSCGLPVPGVAVKIVGRSGAECASGEIGEIWVRGPNVMAGYFKNPDASADALKGGWYRTGDLGEMRHGSYLFVVDRLKDMIVTGAENVYSIEVEDVLHRHPAVLEAAVFGVPDPTWGEAVRAVVVVEKERAADADALERELKAHCRRSIAGYKVPKTINIQVDPLPKSGPGKILKRALRDPFWADSVRPPPEARAATPAGSEP